MDFLLCLGLIILSCIQLADSSVAQVANRFANILSTNNENSRSSARVFAGADRAVTVQQSAIRSQVTGNSANDFFNIDDLQTLAQSASDTVDKLDVAENSFNTNGRLARVLFRSVRLKGSLACRPGALCAAPAPRPTANDVKTFKIPNCPWNRVNNAVCPTDKYRTIDGHCNNLNKKTWGMAITAFSRVLPPKYQDGIKSVRKGNFAGSGNLPNPRSISVAVTTATNVRDTTGFSAQLMQWGQYIAHEITAIRAVSPTAVCCPDQLARFKNNGQTPTTSQINAARIELDNNPQRKKICHVIEVNNDREFGKPYVCMTQIRTGLSIAEDCTISSRLQANTATHPVDGSVIYGSSTVTMNQLREQGEELSKRGKLKVRRFGGKDLPPPNGACSATEKCPFAAGDGRVNTTPNLASVHTLFVRKHNQIAEELAQANLNWNAEKVFQETRRIIIAIEQNIHFNEWLSTILPPATLIKYGLKKSTSTGFNNVYDTNINPTVLNELAGAALRFGHTAVNSFFTVGPSQVSLTPNFDDPKLVYDNGIGVCLAGLAVDGPGKFDQIFAKSMRNELLGEDSDIVSLNINRGRDHGFDSYVKYRAKYGLSVPNSWRDMLTTHDSSVIDSLESVYSDVKNVELYIGGVTEKPVSGGYVGPLFAEIIGDGFKRLKHGDRFYFEGQQSGFTTAQINTIRQYSYSKLICDVGDVNSLPPNAFRIAGSGNPNTLCGSLPNLDVNLFNDKPLCSWRVKSRSGCCSGQQTVTQECIGSAQCRAGSRGCEGPAEETVSCTCSGWSCNRNCPAASPIQKKKPTREEMCGDATDFMCDFMMEQMEEMGDELGDCHDMMCLMEMLGGKKK